MTNEEKAREYSVAQIADVVTERRIKEAYLNACKWKDQQFKEYLENRIATANSADWDSCWELLNDIIYDFFGETKQDNISYYGKCYYKTTE